MLWNVAKNAKYEQCLVAGHANRLPPLVRRAFGKQIDLYVRMHTENTQNARDVCMCKHCATVVLSDGLIEMCPIVSVASRQQQQQQQAARWVGICIQSVTKMP